MTEMKFKLGSSFSDTAAYFGYVLLGIGLVMVYFTQSWPTFVFLSVGALLSFSFQGVYIDFENKKYKHYFNYLFIQTGTWISYEDYPNVTVLVLSYSNTVTSRYNAQFTVSDGAYHEVYLLSENHLERLIVVRYRTAVEADDTKDDVAKYGGFNPTIFHPRSSRRR
jgi:hypothetical protein